MAGRSAGKRFDRLRFSADDLRLIGTGREQLKTCVWETFGGELTLVQVEGGRGADLRTIDFSPDSQWFVALGATQATFWDADSGREAGTFPLPNARGAWFAADGRHLVASRDPGLFRWELLYKNDGGAPLIQSGVVQRMYKVRDEFDLMPHLEWAERLKSDSNHKSLGDLGVGAVSRDRRTVAVICRNDLLLVPLEP
jgi:hypothetical protein